MREAIETHLRLGRPLATAVLGLALLALAPAVSPAASPKPNIVVVQTDDQDAASLSSRTMPAVARLLQASGTTFTDYVVSGPLCCPSRAVLLTGQYGHNNGVQWNNPGGYVDLRAKHNTLPAWLRRAGYRTAHIGKYLNLYHRAVSDPNAVAPGWDDWQTVLEPVLYYDYVLRDNGRAIRYGSAPDDHLTRVLNRRARRVVERLARKPAPFFLSVDHFAPHRSGPDPGCPIGPAPDPADRDLFPREPLPRPPSFDEANVDDKPSFVALRPRLSPERIAALRREHRCRLASLRGVDRGVAAIHAALRRAGELENTVLVFTSDNGWLDGQHRVPGAKVLPFEETLRVPLVVRLPSRLRPGGGPSRSAAPTANVDLAPTLLALAGARACVGEGACRTLDGRSLLPLLRGQTGTWPRERGTLLELEIPRRRAPALHPCDYEGIRAEGRVLIEHHSATGRQRGACRPTSERELYDLRRDPFELTNLAAPLGEGAPGAREPVLEARLARLRDCAGIAGRDPLPPSGSHCE
jgi:N-acetylglucosamine-6-sulfatase